MAAAVKCLVFYLLFTVCYCSPTTELLETVMRLLNDCARSYPHADLNAPINVKLLGKGRPGIGGDLNSDQFFCSNARPQGSHPGSKKCKFLTPGAAGA